MTLGPTNPDQICVNPPDLLMLMDVMAIPNVISLLGPLIKSESYWPL